MVVDRVTWPYRLALVGAWQACLALLVAACCYPGGSLAHPRAPGYRFFDNALSDLGLTRAWSMGPNAVSALVFNSAMVLLGLTVLPFFLRLADTVPHAPRRGRAAAWLGAVSALGLIGVGLTPFDRLADGHNLALALWLLSLATLLLLQTSAIWRRADYPSHAAWPALVLLGVMALHLVEGAYLMSCFYIYRERPSGAIWQLTVATQKALTLAFLVWGHYWCLRMLRR